MEITPESKCWHTTVGASGRVLLPKELRNELAASPGTKMVWVKSDDGIVLRPLNEVIAAIQEHFKSLGPATEVWSDELIAERREEAARE